MDEGCLGMLGTPACASQERARADEDDSIARRRGGEGLLALARVPVAALGDDERRPRFIRTVRGFGCPFCGGAAEEGARGPTEMER